MNKLEIRTKVTIQELQQYGDSDLWRMEFKAKAVKTDLKVK